MKTLKGIKGVKELSKSEQKEIKGGRQACGNGYKCWPTWTCPVDYHTPGNYECQPGIL